MIFFAGWKRNKDWLVIVVQLKSDRLLSNVDELVEVQSHYLSLYTEDGL